MTNPELLCATTGEICPAREKLIKMYRPDDLGQIDSTQIAYDSPFNPRFDEQKLQIKLAENAITAKLSHCDGPTGNTCPTRQNMNNNEARTRFVSLFRSLRMGLRYTER